MSSSAAPLWYFRAGELLGACPRGRACCDAGRTSIQARRTGALSLKREGDEGEEAAQALPGRAFVVSARSTALAPLRSVSGSRALPDLRVSWWLRALKPEENRFFMCRRRYRSAGSRGKARQAIAASAVVAFRMTVVAAPGRRCRTAVGHARSRSSRGPCRPRPPWLATVVSKPTPMGIPVVVVVDEHRCRLTQIV